MSDEYKNLKSALREALKRERSAPWAEQAQRVAEREEVEAHLAKARSRYERYQREQREKKVLQEVKKEERAKQAEGKGEWHMKRGTLLSALICWMVLIFFSRRSRQEGPLVESPIPSARTGRRKAQGQEGDREEAKEDCGQGEEEQAVCARARWRWCWCRGWWGWWR